MIGSGDLTHEVLVGYFGEHCECRPLNVDRICAWISQRNAGVVSTPGFRP